MKAEEARKLSSEHSKRIQKVYALIAESAKKGNNEVWLSTSEASGHELDVLRSNGYTAGYETSEVDGGQFVVIKW